MTAYLYGINKKQYEEYENAKWPTVTYVRTRGPKLKEYSCAKEFREAVGSRMYFWLFDGEKESAVVARGEIGLPCKVGDTGYREQHTDFDCVWIYNIEWVNKAIGKKRSEWLKKKEIHLPKPVLAKLIEQVDVAVAQRLDSTW